MKTIERIVLTLALALPCAHASADEGFWLFERFPREEVQKRYGFTLSDAWLQRAQRSALRVGPRCSGAFVSPRGLVVTAQHCVEACLQSTAPSSNGFAAGFLAQRPGAERPCQGLEIAQLESVEDVTARVAAAVQGVTGPQLADALAEEISRIEAACAAASPFRCEVVSLYEGGLRELYRYRIISDVRLVFAPEIEVAYFGGTADNFSYPRYALDVAFLRAYEGGAPAQTPEALRWNPKVAAQGELYFVPGNPGWTQRLYSAARLEFHRDTDLAANIPWLANLHGRLTEFARRSPANQRAAQRDITDLEDILKARRILHDELSAGPFVRDRARSDEALRAQIAKVPAQQRMYGDAWAEIERALALARGYHRRLQLLERLPPTVSPVLEVGRALVRAASERALPNERRLREYRDAALPSIEQKVLGPLPFVPELEQLRLAFWLEQIEETLGHDDPLVQSLLGKESPEAVARAVVRGTRLGDVAVRRAYWKEGLARVQSSQDPMIRLLAVIDPAAREIRRLAETTAEVPLATASGLVTRAAFEIHRSALSPDGTFTPRLSFGTVQGYTEDGRVAPPMTTLEGLYARSTARESFRLPPAWIAARSRVNLATPLNFVTTADISAKGHSGSAVMTPGFEWVGVIFDSNPAGLGTAFAYGDPAARGVAVHAGAVVEALTHIYRADSLVQEITEAPKGQDR